MKRHTLLNASLLFSLASAAESSPFVVGEAVPRLRLASMAGESASLADFRGEKLMLHVFASW